MHQTWGIAIWFVLTLGQSLLIFLLRDIEVVDICCMVLAVMKLHNLSTDVRLKCTIVVCEVRESVLLSGGHSSQDGVEGCSAPIVDSNKEILMFWIKHCYKQTKKYVKLCWIIVLNSLDYCCMECHMTRSFKLGYMGLK